MGFKLQPPFSPSSGSITLLEACRGESQLTSYLVPCRFVCVCVCITIPDVLVFPLFVGLHMLGASAVFVFACLCVFLAAAASLRVLSCVPLDKAIQASPRTPPQS